MSHGRAVVNSARERKKSYGPAGSVSAVTMECPEESVGVLLPGYQKDQCVAAVGGLDGAGPEHPAKLAGSCFVYSFEHGSLGTRKGIEFMGVLSTNGTGMRRGTPTGRDRSVLDPPIGSRYHRAMFAMDWFWSYRCNLRGCCCSGWRIGFKESDYHRLIRAARGTPLENLAGEALETSIDGQEPSLIPPPSSQLRFGSEFARVAFDERGGCRFLDGDGRCRVHGELGEDALPELCANFPVVGLVTPDGIECFFETACPEVLRCLVEEPGELEVTPAPRSFERKIIAFEYDDPIRHVRLTPDTVVAFDDYSRYRAQALATIRQNEDEPLAALARLLWYVTEWAARGHTVRSLDGYDLDEGAYVTALAHLAACFRSACVTWPILEGRLGLARQFLGHLPWRVDQRLDRLSGTEVPGVHAAAEALDGLDPSGLRVLARFLASRVFSIPLQNEDSLLGGTLSLAERVGTGLYLAGAFGVIDRSPPGAEAMGLALGIADILFRARKEAPPEFAIRRRLTEVRLDDPLGRPTDLIPVLANLDTPAEVAGAYADGGDEYLAGDAVLRGRLRLALDTHSGAVRKGLEDPADVPLDDPWMPGGNPLAEEVLAAQRQWFARVTDSGDEVPLAVLCRRVRLNELETALVAMLMRVQSDTNWARSVAHVGLDYGASAPALSTLVALFGLEINEVLGPGGRLVRLHIVGDVPGKAKSTSRRIRLDSTVGAFLSGGQPGLPDEVQEASPDSDLSACLLPIPGPVVDGFRHRWEQAPAGTGCVLQLGAHRYDPSTLTRTGTGREPVVLDTEDPGFLFEGDGRRVRIAVREALVRAGPLLLIIGGEAAADPRLGGLIAEAASFLREPVIVAAAVRPPGLYGDCEVVEWLADAPSAEYLAALVARSVPKELLMGDPEFIRQAVEGLAITPASVVAAASSAGTASLLNGRAGGQSRFSTGRLIKAMRSQLRTQLGEFADVVSVGQGMKDLVLPSESKERLEEMLTSWRHREQVLEGWGFGARMSHSRGLTSLFYGPPGTGKTMAAGIMARELGLEVFRVDLSRVVDKYIGETEKHLSRVFEEAERGQVMLLFDEADSLFGRRTSGGSSVDRYANMEVNYLLQRMERYEGVVVLTTNNERQLDEAFKRRIRYRVYFPLPTKAERERIWRGLFPAEAATSGDLDWMQLAGQYEMSGGHIRNAMLRAAYLSAEAGGGVTMTSLKRAADMEYRELGKLVREEEGGNS